VRARLELGAHQQERGRRPPRSSSSRTARCGTATSGRHRLEAVTGEPAPVADGDRRHPPKLAVTDWRPARPGGGGRWPTRARSRSSPAGRGRLRRDLLGGGGRHRHRQRVHRQRGLRGGGPAQAARRRHPRHHRQGRHLAPAADHARARRAPGAAAQARREAAASSRAGRWRGGASGSGTRCRCRPRARSPRRSSLALLAAKLGTWTLGSTGIWVRKDGLTEDEANAPYEREAAA
jgi:hypothetical protein